MASSASAAESSARAYCKGQSSENYASQPPLGQVPAAPASSHGSSPVAVAERLAARNSRRGQRAAAREAQAARSRRFSELEAAKASQRATMPASDPHAHLTSSSEPLSAAAPMKCQHKPVSEAGGASQLASMSSAELHPDRLSRPLPQSAMTIDSHSRAKASVPKQEQESQLHPQAGSARPSSKGKRRSKSLSPTLSEGSSHASGSMLDEPACSVAPPVDITFAPTAYHQSALTQPADGVHADSTASDSQPSDLRTPDGVRSTAQNQESNEPAGSSPRSACDPPTASRRTAGNHEPCLPPVSGSVSASVSQPTTFQSTPSQEVGALEAGGIAPESPRGPQQGVASRIDNPSASPTQQQVVMAAHAVPETVHPGTSNLQSQIPVRSKASPQGAVPQAMGCSGAPAVSSPDGQLQKVSASEGSQSARQQPASSFQIVSQSASSPARQVLEQLGSQDTSRQGTAPSEAASGLQSSLDTQDVARQHRCKCKAAADGTVPRPCRFCRNMRLMTRLAHKKQVKANAEDFPPTCVFVETMSPIRHAPAENLRLELIIQCLAAAAYAPWVRIGVQHGMLSCHVASIASVLRRLAHMLRNMPACKSGFCQK